MSVPHDFIPSNEQELAIALLDPMWRLCSGVLYKILVKTEMDEDGLCVPFKPNRAQRRFISRLHNRNVILKARQLGFTTLICIMWLDHALFNANQRCGIIAQDREIAESIFRDKVKFAYEHLPAALRHAMPLKRDSAAELYFAHNNSSMRVATSMRGGTIQRLHVSEFGKIGAKYPDKAQEIITGSLPAVPLDGIVVIESTSEGREGEFFKICQQAEALMQSGAELNERQYQFHFFAWHESPDYQMDVTGIVVTPKQHQYFDGIEAEVGCKISMRQRAWYAATQAADFSGDAEKMWQEYPSTPAEAFQQSTEGTYYAVQLAAARRDGRIGRVPMVSGVPVNTFWDIGSEDGTAIWFHQRIGAEDRFIRFYEAWGEPYSHFIQFMQGLGYVWGRHFLPHDGDHTRQYAERVAKPIDMLEELTPGWTWIIVPRVNDIMDGIQVTRQAFATSWFDETLCAEGLVHLSMYKKEWITKLGCWGSRPVHDVHSEAADSYRQFAQAGNNYGRVNTGTRIIRRNTSGMAA